jgi:hypothetical protein
MLIHALVAIVYMLFFMLYSTRLKIWFSTEAKAPAVRRSQVCSYISNIE